MHIFPTNSKTCRTVLAAAIFTLSLGAQTLAPADAAPGSRLVLVPSEPLEEPKPVTPTPPAVANHGEIRPSILKLVPPGDPIYLVEEPAPDRTDHWRTYRRPKVDRFSRNGDGIGAQGYDLVSYREQHAEPGTKEFSLDYDGVTWRFASAEHLREFRSDPERFLPEYGGFCAYSVGKGYPATADPRAFAIEGGRLYLFFNRAVQTVWQQDQQRLTAMADRNWPGLHR